MSSHEGEKLELGQLKQEVIHAIQKPFIRLGGLEEFHHPKPWKAHIKKMVRERTNLLQSSVTYEISNEILEYLEPQVEKRQSAPALQSYDECPPSSF